MKAKRKIGMGCKGKRKRITKNNSMLTAKKKRTSKKKNSGKRLIPIPGQSGGVVPLIPIFAGLSALGSLMSGGASVYNAIQNSKKEGCYEIEDINNKIAKELSQVNNNYGTQLTFSVRIDPVDFKTYIKCNGILQFNTPCSIAPVFGFKKIRCGPFHEARRSDKAVNLNTINSIKVLCNIAHGSFNNQLQSHSIYEFFPSGRTGTKVVQSPSNLIYYRLNKTDINLITVHMAPVFGFEKRQYKPEYAIHRSEKAVNLNTINSIKLMCNIAQGSFNNHLQSHSIYEFFPSERTVSNLVDQDHNPIDNFGEALTIVLHIKRYGS
ncbi:hypothetical protein AGLY_018327 [Aphis glycines]|uniref:Uncharacterized protein n=1 Tax=Aphis glycines TaxID=307491 RepID=A0A6G0STG9_APHGL|nr:hypothetical protein AGLY_018327 [Aphis glycines]